MSHRETFDLVVLGAGIFGSYAARHFSGQGRRVLLVDREPRPWNKASAVNQARVHSGYHYPRSIKTARLANDHRRRFLDEHDYAINSKFVAYHAIEKRNSLTDAAQFERFCNKLDIGLVESKRSDLFNHDHFEAMYEAKEYSFDPLLIRQAYYAAIEESSVETLFGWFPSEVERDSDHWTLSLSCDDEDERRVVRARNVINATYANINTVNRLFGIDELQVGHELSEMVIVHCEALANVGLTIMDGPYISIMPYGKSGLSSLSSVRYTHTAYSAAPDPVFPCQDERADCTPNSVRNCTDCRVKPPSNARKMLKQLSNYLAKDFQVFKHGALMTVKTKLRSSMRDDGRPTEVHTYSRTPFFGCVFSGKINSIYEVEEFNLND